MEQPTERLSEIVFMVRHRKTGLWSSGGTRPKWRKRGKIWRKRSDVALHLAQFEDTSAGSTAYRNDAELVRCRLVIAPPEGGRRVHSPRQLPVTRVARSLGWSTQRTVRWLRRLHAVQRIKGRWVTTTQLVREHFPELELHRPDEVVEPAAFRLPVYLTPRDVGKLLGWPTWKARRWLQREGARVRVAGRWVTTPRLLRAHFPDAFDVLA